MKRYTNARDVLPESLIREIQKYVKGQHLYIPQTERRDWGTTTGIREELLQRNREIYRKFLEGINVRSLSEIYHLSEERIRAIIHEQQTE
ncbi:CD3324 family protein [Paenibacillus ginsengihumi]|uniref:CD3324 family protein n=1 Tax=Paenibacillus ginsengihumi TaxID=431596 RepID=UPI000380649E|nr:CD3324 family protein [Paenibacillus ginsengihumi]